MKSNKDIIDAAINIHKSVADKISEGDLMSQMNQLAIDLEYTLNENGVTDLKSRDVFFGMCAFQKLKDLNKSLKK